MPVPTSYTMQSFEDYLKYEVLQETAFSLGWAVDLPETPVTWSVILVEVRPNANMVRVEPLEYPIAARTELQFIHRNTGVLLPLVETAEPAYADNEHIILINPFSSTFELEPSVNYRAETTTPYKIQLFEPIFEPVIGEVLAELGVEDITTITGFENIAKLRARGRMEIWKKVMNFTSFDYPTSTESVQLNRQQIFSNASRQLNMAQAEYYAFADNVEIQDIPVQNTKASKVKVVW